MNTLSLLQECLDRLERGETMDQVLAQYPDQRKELGQLLAVATSLQRAAPKMPDTARARVRYELQGAMRANAPARGMPLWQTWVLRVALSLVVVLALGGGTLAAAAESAPGRPLFPARAALNETRARIITDPGTVIVLHLELAQDRVEDVRILKQRGGLNEAPIFLMVGATENLMVALENNPRAADRATLERAVRLVQDERTLLRDLTQTAPVDRARRNSETLYQLSESWMPLLNRLLAR
jgi:hypothetical protein